MQLLQTQPAYVQTADEILKLGIKEIPMLIERLLQKKGVMTLTGSSDSGKSYLSLFLAQIICGSQDECFGRKIHRKSGSVLFVCTEDSAEDICVRLTPLNDIQKFDSKKLRFIFDTVNLTEKLNNELHREPADLVILDTFGDLFRGSINDSIAVRQYLKPLKELAEKHKCLFLLNHHIGKSKEGLDSPNKTDLLGSQAIESSCRGVLILKKRADGKRILTIVKGNHSSDEIKNKGIVLSFSVKKGFEVTGETVIYEGEHFPSDDILMLKNEVLALYPVLNSYKKVADKLKEKGFKKVDKNKVGEIWKKYRPSVTQPKKKAGRIGSDNSTDLTQINAENVSDNSDHSLIISCEGDKQTEELKVEPTITQTLIQKDSVIVHPSTNPEENDGRTNEENNKPETELF